MPVLAHVRQHNVDERNPANVAFTPEEAENLFDATARQYMGISGAEFLQAWDHGKFREAEVNTRAMRVAILIPLVRKTSARKKSR